MISFSIVIPVYKTEEYLNCCIESVITQSYNNFEIILVDDGSPDNCGKICDEWNQKDNRIKVVHRQNGGLSVARNTGIRYATGDFIMFLDSDDYWKDCRVLEKIADRLAKTDVDVLSFNYQKNFNSKLEKPYFPPEASDSTEAESFAQMMENCRYVTGACNKVIRRTLITDNSLYFREGITSEDIDWSLRVALCCDRFAFLSECVFIYRQRSSSISHSMSPKKVYCLCDNVRECVRLIEKCGNDKAEPAKAFTAYQYGTLLYNAANLLSSQRRGMLMAEIKDMKWLLNCYDNRKIVLLRKSVRLFGLACTFKLLKLRQWISDKKGKGV